MANDVSVLREVWEDTYHAIKDVRGVKVEFRTLFDNEELDCLRQATANADPSVQTFILARMELAYSIVSVQGDAFDGQPESKYAEILKWPSVIVRLCSEKYYDVVKEEDDLIRSLGESGNDQLPMEQEDNSELTGSLVEPSDLEIGPQELPSLDATTSS